MFASPTGYMFTSMMGRTGSYLVLTDEPVEIEK